MRNIRQIFEMYTDASWYDRYCSNIDMNLFRSFLENVKVFLSFNESFKTNVADFNALFDFNVYKRESNYEDELYNYIVKQALTPLLPPLVEVLDRYRTQILDSAYYWAEKDPEYLRMTFNTKWPKYTKMEELVKVNYDKLYSWQLNPDREFHVFLGDVAKKMGLAENYFMKHYF